MTRKLTSLHLTKRCHNVIASAELPLARPVTQSYPSARAVIHSRFLLTLTSFSPLKMDAHQTCGLWHIQTCSCCCQVVTLSVYCMHRCVTIIICSTMELVMIICSYAHRSHSLGSRSQFPGQPAGPKSTMIRIGVEIELEAHNLAYSSN